MLVVQSIYISTIYSGSETLTQSQKSHSVTSFSHGFPSYRSAGRSEYARQNHGTRGKPGSSSWMPYICEAARRFDCVHEAVSSSSSEGIQEVQRRATYTLITSRAIGGCLSNCSSNNNNRPSLGRLTAIKYFLAHYRTQT